MENEFSKLKKKEIEYDYNLIISLVDKARKEDVEAKEQLYGLLMEEIQTVAKVYCHNYAYISSDISDYLYFIFQATETSIKYFDKEKGNFFHMWHLLVSREKSKFVIAKYRKRLQQADCELNFREQCLIENEKVQFELDFDGGNETFMKYYEAEASEKIMNYIENNFSDSDQELLDLWMKSYSIEEIASMTSKSKNGVVSRVYYLINKLRKVFGNVDYL